MKFCDQCGAKLADNARFCGECGNRIEAPQPPVQEYVPPVVEQPPVQSYTPPVQSYTPPVQSYTPPAQSYTPPAQPNYVSDTQGNYSAPQQPYAPAEKKKAKLNIPKVNVPKINIPKIDFSKLSKKHFIMIGGAALALILVLILCFAGGGKDDPNVGMYKAVSCQVMGFDMECDGEYIELKKGGKASISLAGDTFNGKWELDGEDITIKQAGDEFTGTLSNGVLVMDFGGLVYTYEREGGAPAASTSNAGGIAGAVQGAAESNAAAPKEEYYKAVSAVLSGEEYDEEQLSLMGNLYLCLNSNGTGTINMFGEVYDLTYSDKNLIISGLSCPYTREGKNIVLTMYENTMEYTLAPTDSFVGAPTAANSGSGELDPSQLEYWEGDWYGWWAINDVDVGDTSLEGSWWDCCANLELDENGSGTMYIWDEDCSRSDPMSECGMTVSIVNGNVARFCSEDGWFYESPVQHADWLCYSDDDQFADVMWFEGHFKGDNDEFDFTVYMRPWGTLWDDVAEVEPDTMPYYYYDWYLPLVEGGAAEAPETIG